MPRKQQPIEPPKVSQTIVLELVTPQVAYLRDCAEKMGKTLDEIVSEVVSVVIDNFGATDDLLEVMHYYFENFHNEAQDEIDETTLPMDLEE